MNDLDDFLRKDVGAFRGLAFGVLVLLVLLAIYATAHIAWKVFAAGSASSSVEIAAAFFGVLGTLMLATKTRFAGFGFLAFLASNCGWLWFSHTHGHQWMFWQQVAFTISSVIGIWVWLVNPRSEEAAP